MASVLMRLFLLLVLCLRLLLLLLLLLLLVRPPPSARELAVVRLLEVEAPKSLHKMSQACVSQASNARAGPCGLPQMKGRTVWGGPPGVSGGACSTRWMS